MSYNSGDIILNKYRIESLIGQGAFAEVYHATHLALNAPRALKILRKDAPGVGSTEYSDFHARFKLEAQLGAKLGHPNIIRVYDFEKNNETLILVMEYAQRGSLAERLSKAKENNQLIAINESLQIALNVAQGLTAIHALDAVHRDLKPSNILFDKGDNAKIADVGLAQIPGGPSMRSQLSVAAPHPGTPGYMSPEQEAINNYLSPCSDVYALGLVLFETLTGRVYRAQRPGTRASELRKDIPAWLDDLIVKMLAKNPEERPWNGEETASLLENGIKSKEECKKELAKQEIQIQRKAEKKAPQKNESEKRARKEAEKSPQPSVVSPQQPTVSRERSAVNKQPLADSSPLKADRRKLSADSSKLKAESPWWKKWQVRVGFTGILSIFTCFMLGVIFWPKSPQSKPTSIETTVSSNLENPTKEPIKETKEKSSDTVEPTEKPESTAEDITTLASEITDNYGVTMVLVPTGQFEMGEGASALTITLDDYYIDKYEVTNANYAECVESGYCEHSGGGASLTRDSYYGNPQYADYPVFVDWQTAQTYCEWREAKLPTEPEWEKAARGIDGRTYPWGEGIDCNLVSYSECADDTSPVGSYPKGVSPYGVYDMAGNVWEWVYYEDAQTLHVDSADQILRGGAWYSSKGLVQVTSRVKYGPSIPMFGVGFRCARSSETP